MVTIKLESVVLICSEEHIGKRARDLVPSSALITWALFYPTDGEGAKAPKGRQKKRGKTKGRCNY